MNKQLKFLFTVMFLVNSAWSAEVGGPPELKEIECKVKPIDRSKVHPKQSFRDESFTNKAISSPAKSPNWSGYVAAPTFEASEAGSVTYVAGSWIVPTLLPTPDSSYCAIWVGIDGFLDHTVEQIGTAHNWESGEQQNFAWFEMYPSGSYEIVGFPVENGDMIGAKVAYKGNDQFKLIITNHTKAVTTTVPVSYTTASVDRSSAEWVVEAPYSGGILPLSDFQIATLNYCAATINGKLGMINDDLWKNESITMGNSTMLKAVPSVLLKDGSCFQVRWVHE